MKKLLLALVAMLPFFICSCEKENRNPLSNTLWCYTDEGLYSTQYYYIEFRDDYSVRAWRPKYEDGTGTYSVDGNNVVFDLVQPTWAKFESATFTSTSMVVQYRYVFSDGSIGDHIYERTYIKQ